MPEPPTARSKEILDQLLGPSVKPEVLFAELDDLLRNRPTAEALDRGTEDALAWLGRAKATLQAWNPVEATAFLKVELELNSPDSIRRPAIAFRTATVLIQQALASLRLQVAPTSVAVDQSMVFEYFEGLRKIIERATADLLFVDPYLDADFVSRYLGFVRPGISVRLLAGKGKLATLLPAIEAFAKQNGTQIAVRSTEKIHDRFVFVDGKECFQSGASFKDGAAKAPTTMTQITDAFPAMLKTYEDLWAGARPER